ncbi:hypothetical protein G6F59_018022 [Rhizopus arrhizus]|nr:hypothetical protein G6F59_018022 [Rhizopus arrhizus]
MRRAAQVQVAQRFARKFHELDEFTQAADARLQRGPEHVRDGALLSDFIAAILVMPARQAAAQHFGQRRIQLLANALHAIMAAHAWAG